MSNPFIVAEQNRILQAAKDRQSATLGTISSRPSNGSYNGNIPSTISDPTPSVLQPVLNAKPTNIAAVDVAVPQNTSQINNTVTRPPSTNVASAGNVNGMSKYVIYGLAIIAIVIIYILLKKYKKI